MKPNEEFMDYITRWTDIYSELDLDSPRVSVYLIANNVDPVMKGWLSLRRWLNFAHLKDEGHRIQEMVQTGILHQKNVKIDTPCEEVNNVQRGANAQRNLKNRGANNNLNRYSNANNGNQRLKEAPKGNSTRLYRSLTLLLHSTAAIERIWVTTCQSSSFPKRGSFRYCPFPRILTLIGAFRFRILSMTFMIKTESTEI